MLIIPLNLDSVLLFLHNSKLAYYGSIYSRILTRVCVVAMATGLVKNKAQIMVFVYFKKIQSLNCFHISHKTN